MKFLNVSLATLAMSVACVAPTTDRLDLVKRAEADKPYFYPATEVKSLELPPAFGEVNHENAVSSIKALVAKDLNVAETDLDVQKSYRDSFGIDHIFFVHKINGVVVSNHNAAVHAKNGKVVSYSASFKGGNNSFAAQETTPKISLEQAVKVAKEKFGAEKDSIPAQLAFVEAADGSLKLVHQFQVQDAKKPTFLRVSVDAASGEIAEVVDYVNFASYNVIALPDKTPLDGLTTVSDPQDKTASPSGWHSGSTDTSGNNVIAAIAGKTESGGANLVFDTTFDGSAEPTTANNKRLSTVNVFYLANMMHDITYKYGFTEAAGNFQNDNYGKGGKGNDRVVISNQSNEGTNNAYFSTPPDGQSGKMAMFRFTMTTPGRDGSLDNLIPIHEYGHGVSNRMTGGSANGQCLQTTEAGGMGEGWSDTFGIYLERSEKDTRASDVAAGDYATGNPKGIRKYPYSTNMQVNPHTYADLKSLNQVHAIGTVWATMLNEVYWNLVDKHGYSANWYDNTQTQGNIVAMQLVIGGLSLQPCNPTFLSARDAILKFDQTNYGGKHSCDIWKAFAKRGLGVNAKQSGYVADTSIPAQCNGVPVTTSAVTPQPTTVAVTTTTKTTTTTTTTTTSAAPTSTSAACAHSKCVTGTPLKAACDPCVAKIIAADPFCGRSSWDSLCVRQVRTVCNETC